jgi:hypothetical protein
MKKLVMVSWKKYYQAEKNWDSLYNRKKKREAYFFKFLGNQRSIQSTSLITMVPEDAANKINMLASPHYKTLMKMFIIKTGYHREIPK